MSRPRLHRAAPYWLAECRLADIRRIIPNLRPEDLQEASASGVSPRRFLYRLWNESAVKRAAHIGSEIAAVWGCVGGLSDPSGEPWLFTAHCIETMPVTFFKVAAMEIARLLDTRTELETGVLASYSRSRKFWRMMGFEEVGAYEVNGVSFVKLRMGHD